MFQGHVLSWNLACERATGFSLEAARGLRFPELAENAPRIVELALPAPGGASRRVVWRTSPGSGREVVAVGFDAREVEEAARVDAESKRTERPLAESDAERRWLQAVIDTVPVGVLLFDASGRLRFNRHAEELLGTKLVPEGGAAQYRDRILYRNGAPVPPEDSCSPLASCTTGSRSGSRSTSSDSPTARCDPCSGAVLPSSTTAGG